MAQRNQAITLAQLGERPPQKEGVIAGVIHELQRTHQKRRRLTATHRAPVQTLTAIVHHELELRHTDRRKQRAVLPQRREETSQRNMQLLTEKIRLSRGSRHVASPENMLSELKKYFRPNPKTATPETQDARWNRDAGGARLDVTSPACRSVGLPWASSRLPRSTMGLGTGRVTVAGVVAMTR
jgi:hypothetical protein